MKKRIIWLSLALAMGQASHAFAQDATDALRYSQQQFGGPARTQGIAGANVALGADFGNLSSNPAGLGFYQKSEIHASLGLGFGQTDGSLNAGKLNEQSNNVNIPSLGLVLATRRADSDQSSSWRGGTFALGFTRLADFNKTSNYQGTVDDGQSFFQRLREPRTTVADVSNQYYNGSNGTYLNLDGLAYGGYLTNINKIRQGSDSALVTIARTGPIGQGERVVSTGSMSQFDLGYGGSFRDRLYIGVGLGIVSSNYREARDFYETESDPATPFAGLQLHDELRTTGTGINGRLGLIYRVTNAVRLGASIQTPTFMRLTDTYSTTLTTNFTPLNQRLNPPIGTVTNSTAPGAYDYVLTTPFRANGGATVVVGKYGFISGDVEYVGYGQARLNSDPNSTNGDNASFASQNQDIQSLYRNTLNYRVGAEGRYSVFRARLGYAYYGDPYQNPGNGHSSARSYYTAGLGLRQGNFFVDVAEVYNSYDNYYSPYYLGSGQEPQVALNNSRYTTAITAGLTF